MAYGLWLHKEVQGKDGLVRLEIKKKEYNGESIEIDALIKDSITLSMDGTEITDPIIGTSLSFSIADTEQIDTSLFFTPDATMYEVMLYVDGVKIWDGFLTPDSYQENLAYRDVITLTARDNLGRLNDFIFANAQGMMSISSLLPTLLQEVGVVIDYAWYTKKKSTASADISDYNSIFYSYVNTDYFIGKTYRDILEEILLSIGCQLRYTYTDSMGYHLGIYDISQLPTIDSVGAIFIEKSGLKEIRPAWKEITITQQYQLIESFYRGQFTEQMCNDNTEFTVFDPAIANPEYWRQSSDSVIMLVNPWEWTATSISKQDLYDDYSNHIYIPVIKVDKENDIPTTQEYIAYHQIIPKAERGISIKLMINNSLRTNNGLLDFIVGSFNMKFRFNVVLKTSEKEYFLRDYWVENDPNGFLEFDLDHRQGQSNNKDQQIDIIVNNIPEDGEIELRIYQPITISNRVVGAEGYALIKDIQMSYNIEMSGQSSRVEINKKHNIKSSLDLPYGQVPVLRGGYLSFANGFFASNGKALISWKLTSDNIISYNLLELVAREHIHFNKDNYTILSGTMIGDDARVSLANNIAYKGKKYTIISASHSIISGTLNITKMQEVTQYQVAELTIIDSPLELSSGSKVGSGNNEVIQFSNDAGNAKRVYELETATDDDREGAYVLIDKPSLPTARRVPISSLGGGAFDKAFQVHYNPDGTIKSIQALASLWTDYDLSAGGEGGGDIPGGITEVTAQMITDALGYTPVSPTDKLANPYALVINGQRYDGSSEVVVDINGGVSGDYLPITGGTITGDLSLNQYLRINAWSGYGSGSANVWYNGTTQRLLWENVEDMAFGSKLVLHSGNYSNYALPLSGGTIDSSNSIPLAVNTSSNVEVAVKLTQNAQLRAVIGYDIYSGAYIQNGINNLFLGIADDGTPYYHNGSYKYTLIHSGNYSDYALPKSGGTIEGTTDTPLHVKSSYLSTYIGFDNYNGIVGYYGFNHEGTPEVYVGTMDYDIIHSGNIGSYNAGSATKLQTARTIWGQSFDGTANIDTTTYGMMRWLYFSNSSGVEQGYVGRGSETNDIYLVVYGENNLRFGTNNATRATITPNGNVLIGTTEDTGNKLDVRGKVLIYDSNKTSLDSTVVANSALLHISSMGNGNDGLYIGHLVNGVSWLQSAYHGSTSYPSSNHTYPLALNPLGGNVLIGTTADNGAKLQVNGNIYASGDITAGSDARYKTRLYDVSVDIDTIANAPLFDFKWNDREDNDIHLGTTAQYWANTAFKHAVRPTNDDRLWTMSYGQIAMANSIIIARKVVNHEERIKQLEEEIKRLKKEQYEY